MFANVIPAGGYAAHESGLCSTTMYAVDSGTFGFNRRRLGSMLNLPFCPDCLEIDDTSA